MSTPAKLTPAAAQPVAQPKATTAAHPLSKQAVIDGAKAALGKTVEYVINPSNLRQGALNFALMWAMLYDGKNGRVASETAAKIVLIGAGADLAANILLNPSKNKNAPTTCTLASTAFAYVRPQLAALPIPGASILGRVNDWAPLALSLYSRSHCSHC